MKDTRVKSAGEKKTPIQGAPQQKDDVMKGGRVAKKSEIPRKNDPKATYSKMGLTVGSRVYRGKR